MKKIAFFVSTFLLLNITSKAQHMEEHKIEQPFIEVVGSAEKEVVPDMIFIAFSLSKTEQEKNKPSIENQEKNMLEKLRAAGLDTKELKLTNTSGGDYFYWKRKERYQESKSFELKVKDAAQAAKAFEILSDIQATNMYISHTEHSQIQQYKDEIKQEAVKAAKAKAEKMLAAIGEKLGKVLIVLEVEDGGYAQPMYANVRMMAMKDGAMGGDYQQDQDITFQKIKLTAQVKARFSILP